MPIVYIVLAMLGLTAVPASQATLSGHLYDVAGQVALPGFGGDGGPALSAQIDGVQGLAVDAAGNIFLSDYNNHRVRRVDRATGIITTVAGDGTPGFFGEGIPAAIAWLWHPTALALDAGGNLLIADTHNQRIRRVDALTGLITTVAGNGLVGYSGDGGPATSAGFNYPYGILVEPDGDLLVGDQYNARIRRVDAATGVITTIAGNGTFGYAGDGGPAIAASFEAPTRMGLDSAGNLFVVEYVRRVRRIDALTQIVTTVVGSGSAGAGQTVHGAYDIFVDGGDNLFVADQIAAGSEHVWRFPPTFDDVAVVAGASGVGDASDGVPGSQAQLEGIGALGADHSLGVLYVGQVSRLSSVAAAVQCSDDLADGDADGQCDLWDPCTNPSDGQTFTRAKLRLRKLLDGTPGNDKLLLIADVGNVDPGAIDPIAGGVSIQVEDEHGIGVLEIPLPAVAYAGPETRGWLSKGGNWKYFDSTGATIEGVSKASIKATSADSVRLVLKGKRATYDLQQGLDPLSVVVTFGGQAEAAAGLCGEVTFTLEECQAASFLTCAH
jgi:sugar lactone lactonase YvrE